MSEQDSTNPKKEDSPEDETPPPMESEEVSSGENETPADDGVPESADAPDSADTVEAPPELAARSSNVLERGTLSATDEKTIGMLVHLLGGITYILGPLLIWLIKKDESPFVQDQGKEAINFQITVIIALAVASAAGLIPFVGGCVAPLLWPVVVVGNLILAILGGLEANKGIIYRYPFCLRLIT